MDLPQLQELIKGDNPQDRMRAITALRHCDAEIAVPLLLECAADQELIIRSFVAIGLGKKHTPVAYEALLEMLSSDRDPNVRAEAANSLASYGPQAIPHLVQAFQSYSDWVIRFSILPALAELQDPDALWIICQDALQDPEPMVREAAIDQFPYFHDTFYHDQGLEILLTLVQAERWQTRQQVAIALAKFDDIRAQTALMHLRTDRDYRVVAAALQPLMR